MFPKHFRLAAAATSACALISCGSSSSIGNRPPPQAYMTDRGSVVEFRSFPGGNSNEIKAVMADFEGRSPNPPLVKLLEYCNSSCTLLLGYSNVCSDPNTLVGFHGPVNGVTGRAYPPQEQIEVAQSLSQSYPPGLREWYMANAAMLTETEVIRIPARELIDKGYVRSCPA
jgi:hypothetical protein